MKLEGTFTALVTPFDGAGRVDEAALRRLVQGIWRRGWPTGSLQEPPGRHRP